MNEGETGQMRLNASPEFAGVAGVKARQKQQLDQFEQWAASGNWQRFHDSHYDWWMFPIDRDSRGEGARWTVYAGDVAILKQDGAFLQDYLRGVELLMASWGWDLKRQTFLPDPAPDQHWQAWPVRLHKAATSLRLFGFEDEFQSLKNYAQILLERGENFNDGYDLSRLFTEASDKTTADGPSHRAY